MTTGTEPSELERLKQELDHEHQMHLRALADFDRLMPGRGNGPAFGIVNCRASRCASLCPKRDDHHRALAHFKCMIFSQKPLHTFPDHALRSAS